MFGAFAVFYLFLGGAGAGAIAVCSLTDLLVAKQPFGTSAYVPGPSVRPLGRIVDYGFLAGFVALAVGIVSLLLDLGRIDRALALFLSPTMSVMTLGSYALAVLASFGATLVLVRFMYLPFVKRPVVVALETIAIAVALVVMLYTGLLLQSVGGVAFWASPLVPALFVLSSASSGIALVFAASFFVEHDRTCVRVLRALVRADAMVIVLEAVCAVGFIALAGQSGHPGVQESLVILTQGELALVWWLGFGVCGLAAPLVVEIAGMRGRGTLHVALAVSAVLVLIGAFCLRFAVVEAGVHRDLVLEDSASSATMRLESTMEETIDLAEVLQPSQADGSE